MNISDYIKSKISKNSPPITTPEEACKRYSKMNEEQLICELFRNADSARENGELSDAMLDDFYNNAKNYLTPEQAAKMKELIGELKK